MAKKFFEYKGYPLVRCENDIYYGSMGDDYVVWIQILSTKKVGNDEIADRVKVRLVPTAGGIPEKVSDKVGLYEALDIAHIWLTRYNSDKKSAS